MSDDKVKGQMGFKKESGDEVEKLDKEETLFKIGPDGEALPEEVVVEVYDRSIDQELLEEAMQLAGLMKRKKATTDLLKELKNEQNKKIKEFEKELEKEKDESKKALLKKALQKAKNDRDASDVKTRLQFKIVEDGIRESNEVIKELKKLKKEQVKKYKALIVPCTVGEAVSCFEKGLSVKGEKVSDWLSQLIVDKVKDPKYSLEEAKRLRPDFKIGFKEAIMMVSNYRTKSYRDLLNEELVKGSLREKKG